jgi:galactose mutarotase-like enzyme
MARGLVLEDEFLRAVCYPEHGFTIGSVLDKHHEVELLWNPSGSDFAPLTTNLGPAGPASNEFFDRHVLAGGWFAMFPNSGPVSADTSRWMHGEIARIPWTVVSATDSQLVCSVKTPSSGFIVTRTVSLNRGKITTRTTAFNVSEQSIAVTFGEHPCFRRGVFAGGRIDAPVASPGISGSQGDPEHSQLAPGQTFLWPSAHSKSGAELDLAEIPDEPDGRHNHAVLSGYDGCIAVSSPSGPRVRVSWDAASMEHVLLWQHYRPKSSPWNGDVLAIEPTSTPARTWEESVAQETTKTVVPGESVTFGCSVEIVLDPEHG